MYLNSSTQSTQCLGLTLQISSEIYAKSRSRRIFHFSKKTNKHVTATLGILHCMTGRITPHLFATGVPFELPPN